MTPTTEELLLEQLAELTGAVKTLSERMRTLEVSHAEAKGRDAGLALNSRLRATEQRLQDQVERIGERPTAEQIDEMLHDQLNAVFVRAVLWSIAAVPVWMAVGFAGASFFLK